MQTYNKIMLYFWLSAAILIFIAVSYLSATDGIKKWGYYYIFCAMAFFAFITRKWMMNRAEKHNEFRQKDKKND
jgi:hypothetical protein